MRQSFDSTSTRNVALGAGLGRIDAEGRRGERARRVEDGGLASEIVALARSLAKSRRLPDLAGVALVHSLGGVMKLVHRALRRGAFQTAGDFLHDGATCSGRGPRRPPE